MFALRDISDEEKIAASYTTLEVIIHINVQGPRGTILNI
jgi:hypothetical protein